MVGNILKTIDSAFGESSTAPEHGNIIPKSVPSDGRVIPPESVGVSDDQIRNILAALGCDSIRLLLERCGAGNIVRASDLEALSKIVWSSVERMSERSPVITIVRKPFPAEIVVPADPKPGSQSDDLQPFRTKELHLRSVAGRFVLPSMYIGVMSDGDVIRSIAYKVVHQARTVMDHLYVCDRSLRLGVEQLGEDFVVYWGLFVYEEVK